MIVHRDFDQGQPTEDIASSALIALVAILLVLGSMAFYAYPRDSQMIVTATNAAAQVQATPQAPTPGR